MKKWSEFMNCGILAVLFAVSGHLISSVFLVGLLFSNSVSVASTLNVAWDTAPRTLDPRYAVDANSQYLMDLKHCSLITFDEEGGVEPDLVAGWSWLKPTVLEFILKENIKFSNGNYLTVNDVKATYDFFISEQQKNPSPLSASFKNLKSVQVSGSKKIIFHLKEIDATFINNLFIGILPANLTMNERIEKAQIPSCGPFVLVSQKPYKLFLERNKFYSLGTAPKISSLVINIVSNETTRFSKLLKGEIDFVQNGIEVSNISRLDLKSYTVKKKIGQNVSYLGFNFRDTNLKKRELRLAIAHAINKNEIIKYILKNTAEPANSF